jgi:intein/homing endonuclease
MKKISDKSKEVQLCGGGRGCFLPNSPVKMHDTSLVDIKDIKIGDIVISHDGTKQKVVNTLTYEVHEEMLEIEMDDGKKISCTKDHKVLTKGGWKQAKDLVENDDIVEV